jgi:hypothetical protein
MTAIPQSKSSKERTIKARRAFAAAMATGLLVLWHPVPAAADEDDDTTIAVTVTGGELQISVQAATSNLGTVENTPDGTTISGRLGEVNVRDNRNAAGGSGWVATAVATELVPERGPGIGPDHIRYETGSIDTEGTITIEADDGVNLDEARAVVTASEISGNNVARWTPRITITIPPEVVAGTYTGTISHSVS